MSKKDKKKTRLFKRLREIKQKQLEEREFIKKKSDGKV